MLNKRILLLIFLLIFLPLVGCLPSESNQVPAKIIGIEVSPDKITLSVGATLQLEVTAFYDDGNHGDITSDCIYGSSDSFIVVVDSYEGMVTAEALGEAIITITYISDGIVFKDTVEVTVEADVVAKIIGIKVSPDTITLSLGTTLQLGVDALYDDGNHGDITSKCIYSSSDSFIVIVNTYEGKVIAKALGKATIIVTYISDDGTAFTDTVEVTVRADVVEEVTT